MAVPNLFTEIAERQYIGRSSDNVAFAAYWLTGRSEASQQRRFDVRTSGVVVEHTSGGPEDELRHYVAVRSAPRGLILGNGRHVADIGDSLRAGDTFASAMTDHSFELDAPIRTPRIAAVATFASGRWLAQLGSAASNPLVPKDSLHRTLSASIDRPGVGVWITTYEGHSVEPQPSGIPSVCATDMTYDELLPALWASLGEKFRIAALTLPVSGNFDRSQVRTIH